MTKFYYRARTKWGGDVRCDVSAETRAQAVALIEARGEIPVSVYTLPQDLTPEKDQQPGERVAQRQPSKDQLVYRVLAFFFGGLGVHDFYAGRMKEGVMLLALTILSAIGTPLIFIAVFVIVVYEMITVDKDAAGIPMKKSTI